MKGRLYRVVYKDYKATGTFDLSKEDYPKLIDRLGSPNIYFREGAQRVLNEKLAKSRFDIEMRMRQLERVALDPKSPHKARLHALESLFGTQTPDLHFPAKS